MKPISRRDFLDGVVKTGVALVAVPMVPGATASAAGGAAGGPAATAGDRRPAGAPDDDVFAKALARATARGADFADVYWERSSTQRLVLEDDRINRATVDLAMGIGVRVVRGDQTGYAYTEDLTLPAILAAADTAALIATGAARPPATLKPVEVPRRYPAATLLTEVPLARKIELVTAANARARRAHETVAKVQVVLVDELDEVVVATSDGRIARDVRPGCGLSVSIVVGRGERREEAGYTAGGRRGLEFLSQARVDEVVDTAVSRAVAKLDAVVPPAGSMPVVLGPRDSGILLHEAIGHGLEADFNRKKLSIYADRVGQKVCSELCTIVDDGTIEGNRGSLRFDDEAVECERTVLIEKGVLRGYMQDRLSAAVMGARLTGNGRRESYKHPVVPRMRTTYMDPGPHSTDEIIRSVDKGIYAVAIGNGQVNIGPGDFSFYVTFGYLIENGKVTAPIKDVNLIGNGPEVLTRVTMVSGDLGIDTGGFGYCGKNGQRVPVGFGMPHVKVSAITVGGRK